MQAIPLVVAGMLAALLATPAAGRDEAETGLRYEGVAFWGGLLVGGIALLLSR
jgi:hypothetical protein